MGVGSVYVSVKIIPVIKIGNWIIYVNIMAVCIAGCTFLYSALLVICICSRMYQCLVIFKHGSFSDLLANSTNVPEVIKIVQCILEHLLLHDI